MTLECEANVATMRVSNRLRDFRKDKGMTLSDLANRVEMSAAHLSRVENHQSAVTIEALEKLARALGVSMASFFENDERTNPITICRCGEGLTGRIRGGGGFQYQLLASEKRGKLMEPIIVDIASARSRQEPLSHPGEEFNLVLEGEFNLEYGGQVFRLTEGDSAYYDATVPHAARKVRGRPGKVLAIVASRDYLFHGDLSKLINGSIGVSQRSKKTEASSS